MGRKWKGKKLKEGRKTILIERKQEGLEKGKESDKKEGTEGKSRERKGTEGKREREGIT